MAAGALLLAAVPGAERPVDVVEADQPGLEAVVLGEVFAQLLGVELLQPVSRLGIGGKGIILLQRHYRGHVLKILRIDTGRGREQEALDLGVIGRLQHLRADHRVVEGDRGVRAGDVADAAHVRGEIVDLVHAVDRLAAIIHLAQVEEAELIRRAGLVLRVLDIDSSDPITSILEVIDKMEADKAASASDQHRFLGHYFAPLKNGIQ
jgi:hypothetical protein